MRAVASAIRAARQANTREGTQVWSAWRIARRGDPDVEARFERAHVVEPGDWLPGARGRDPWAPRVGKAQSERGDKRLEALRPHDGWCNLRGGEK